VGGGWLLNRSAKALFGRERPKLWESVAPETSLSFPSGHAMASMALIAALVVLLWPTRWRYPTIGLGGIFVLLVGLSRVYLGVHYPSDVLAGWIASFAWVMGVSVLLYGRVGRLASENSPPQRIEAQQGRPNS
jgi:undecaprenyl-diphosphatase